MVTWSFLQFAVGRKRNCKPLNWLLVESEKNFARHRLPTSELRIFLLLFVLLIVFFCITLSEFKI